MSQPLNVGRSTSVSERAEGLIHALKITVGPHFTEKSERIVHRFVDDLVPPADVEAEHAELELLRDLRARVIGFGGDDYAVAAWVDMHRLHKDEPYIGCPFCRDQFVSAAEVEALRAERAAVIDALNIYADSVVHEALTAAGLLLPPAGAQGHKDSSDA